MHEQSNRTTRWGQGSEVKCKPWAKNESGEGVLLEEMFGVRVWFFEQDGGWHVQCRYGSRVRGFGKGNAVFVKSLEEAPDPLVALKAALEAGEPDEAVGNTLKTKGSKADQGGWLRGQIVGRDFLFCVIH